MDSDGTIDRSKTVDLDPESAHEASNIAERRKQNILGWYHSHPIFIVEPSVIDVNNQKEYQKQWNSGNKPFMALIVGPYNKEIKTSTSLLKCFYLPKNSTYPYNLNVHMIPQEYVDEHVFEEIVKRLEHKDLDTNIYISWKQGMTRLQRFKSCLINFVKDNNEARNSFNFTTFLEKNQIDKTVIKEFQTLLSKNDIKIDSKDVDSHFEIFRLINVQEKDKEITKEQLEEALEKAKDKSKKIQINEFLQNTLSKIDEILEKRLEANLDLRNKTYQEVAEVNDIPQFLSQSQGDSNSDMNDNSKG